MLSPAKALRYECLAASVSGSGSNGGEGAGQNSTSEARCQKRNLGNGYTLDLTETIPHVVKDGHKLVRNCSTGKTVYWVCRKRKYGCPKYVHTDSAGTFIKKELGEHNHEPNQNPPPSPENQGADNQESTEEGSEQAPKTEKNGKGGTSSKSSNLKSNESQIAIGETSESQDDQRKPIDCANLVVSSVLAKAMSASATKNALFNNNNNDQTLYSSVNSEKKDGEEFLGGGVNRKRKIVDDCSNLFSYQSFDDSVLDLSNAKNHVYHTSHQDSGPRSHSTISQNNSNQMNALSFPCTNFQHIYHKFTKAIKAINCAGRKFRRLDPATSEGLLSWRCSEKFCRYTLYTDGEVTKILKEGGKHNHELEGPSVEPVALPQPIQSQPQVAAMDLLPQSANPPPIPPPMQQPSLPLLPTTNDIAAVLAETSHLERLLKYQPADLLALMAKFTTDPTSFFNINHAAILPQVPPSISPLALPQTSNICSRATRERSVSPASGSGQSRVILKRKRGAQCVNAEGANFETNNHFDYVGGGSLQLSNSLTSEVLDFSKQAAAVDVDENGVNLAGVNVSSIQDSNTDDGVIYPYNSGDGFKVSTKTSGVTTNGSVAGASSESDGEGFQPQDVTTPTPLPEMPDIIRKEFSVINAPDGRNHILQNGHIFSKDKCSSKSVYWRCKKKLCFAIMHTDLDMTRVTFRRGEHNHEPDPKIEQRARKGHFAKMPRKPRRRRVEIEAEAAAARARSAANNNNNEDAITNSNPPISPIASIDGADCSMIQSTNMFNNNNDETPAEASDTALVNPLFTSPSSVQTLDDLALLSGLTGTSSGSSGSESVTDDLLAILSEAASELKDSNALSDLRDLLSSNIVGDPNNLLNQANGMTSPQGMSTLAAAAAAVVDGSGMILNPHALGRLNKRMINNVLSKFL